jgi:hypothetical protein
MSTIITCPNCTYQFEPSAAMEQAIGDKYKAEFNQKWLSLKKKQDEEIRQREELLVKQREQVELAGKQQEEEIKKKLATAIQQREQQLKEELSVKIAGDFETKLRFLEDTKNSQEKKLKEAQQREMEMLKKEAAMKEREEELELEKQRWMRAESERIKQDQQRQNEAREKEMILEFQLKQKEWEVKFEQQQTALEEARQKAQQGSMQLQGEVQELIIEELLRQSYPIDVIREIKKGAFGADCHITIRNAFGQECGSILLESKRAKEFSQEWLNKLKNDMATKNADLAILVTQVMPKDMDGFGQKDGIYICTMPELKHLIGVLRQGILKVYEARKSQENKGDKMVMLYDYLTSTEFMGQWNAMRESFQSFRNTLQKERDDFEKAWKKKQKLLDVIIANSLQISGSVEGISGMESMNWTALPGDDNKELLD